MYHKLSGCTTNSRLESSESVTYFDFTIGHKTWSHNPLLQQNSKFQTNFHRVNISVLSLPKTESDMFQRKYVLKHEYSMSYSRIKKYPEDTTRICSNFRKYDGFTGWLVL